MIKQEDILRAGFLVAIGFVIQTLLSYTYDLPGYFSAFRWLEDEYRPGYSYAELLFWLGFVIKDLLVCIAMLRLVHQWTLLKYAFRFEWCGQLIDMLFLMLTDYHEVHNSKLLSILFTLGMFGILLLIEERNKNFFNKYRL